MRKNLLLSFLLMTLLPVISWAQVSDVSFVLSPKAGYDWFDAKSTVDNGLMYGFDTGFGFGNIFELRGIFRHSVDLNQTFGEYQSNISDFLNDDNFTFQSRNVSVTRFGGELKANILSGKYSPYLTLGTGVLTFKRDLPNGSTSKNKNIYGSLGLGVKLNITPRMTFDIEGKTFIYNLNPGSLLYDPDSSSAVDDFIGNLNDRRMFNWEVSTGLSFYLGGINSQKLSPLEKAYLRRYSGELYGAKFTLAPAGSYVNFDNKSNFKDTYMLGGSLGIDFTDYFGLQAYYFHSTENNELSFNFDKMAMYGLDFVGRLNIPRGIVPFVTVGGGYLNAQHGYHGRNYNANLPMSDQEVDSKFYAKGGVGVDIPVSTYLSVFGSADLLYTKGDVSSDIADLSSLDQLRQHAIYTAGVRFRIGKKAHTRKATREAFENQFIPERNNYKQKIKDLKEKLDIAYQENDTTEIKSIMRKRKQLENKGQISEKENPENQYFSERYRHSLDSLRTELIAAYDNGNIDKVKQIMKERLELEARNDSLSRAAKGEGQEIVRLTPEELQSLINKTIDKVVQQNDSTAIINRLDHIEELILNLESRPAPPPASNVEPNNSRLNQQRSEQGVETQDTKSDTLRGNGANSNAENSELRAKMNELNQMIENQNARIDQLQKAAKARNQQGEIPRQNTTVVQPPPAQPVNVENNGGAFAYGRRNISAFLGYSIGNASSLNIGLRENYGFQNSRFIFMPEAYLAVSQNYGLGVSANGIYPFNIKSMPRLNPYAGLGLGINFIEGTFTLNPNFIIGTFYPLERSGSVFFDYTVRGGFKYNQLSVGYRFSL